jgi:outer membrane immunogenic protein
MCRILLAFAGAAALMGAAMAAEPASLPLPPPVWTGFYAGLNVGYAWGASNGIGTLTATWRLHTNGAGHLYARKD